MSDQVQYTDGLLNVQPIPEPTTYKSHKVFFFLLGNASLLAFNIFINAIGIYAQITGDPNIGTVLNRCYNIPNAIMALLLCLWKPRSLKPVLISGLSVITLIMCILPILLLVDISTSLQYYLTLVFMGCTGVASSLVFSSAFSLASQFGPESTAAVSSGNGFCGIIAGLLRTITQAAFSSGHEQIVSAAVYYFITAAIVGVTLVYFIILCKNPDLSSRMVAPADSQSVFSRETIEVFKVIWVYWLSVFSNYLITLSQFPGYMSLTQCSSEKLEEWKSLIVTFVFQIFDWIGRYFPSRFMWPKEKYSWIPIASRAIFFLIFVIGINGPAYKLNPWWTFLWDIPFALTNGYFGTVSMIYGSNQDRLSFEEKRFAGLLMPFAVNSGILAAMGLTFAFPSNARPL